MDSSELYFNLASNSLNLFQTEINSTIVDQLLTKYCNEFSTLPNALVICWTKPNVIAPDTIVGAKALAPTIVSGAITLGFVQQITRAFGRVENSLQYLVRSWSTIVELISVWKRLSEFEARLKYNSEESTVENI